MTPASIGISRVSLSISHSDAEIENFQIKSFLFLRYFLESFKKLKYILCLYLAIYISTKNG